MSKKIFVTGISGCVGHYLYDFLKQRTDCEIYLLVRNKSRLKFKVSSTTTIIEDDLKNIEKYRDILSKVDLLVHIAAGWDNKETNYDYSLKLFSLLDHDICQKVIYISTASILDKNNKLNPEIKDLDQCYVQGKYAFAQELPKLKIAPKVITLYPTWVLGGDARHPYSHAAEGIVNLKKWLWLIRFFKFDLSFNFIHAWDIAAVINFLLENDVPEKDIVLGSEVTTLADFLKQVCEFYKYRVYFQISIPRSFLLFLSNFSPSVSPWDRYCISRSDFTFKTVNVKRFGIESPYGAIAGILEDLERA